MGDSRTGRAKGFGNNKTTGPNPRKGFGEAAGVPPGHGGHTGDPRKLVEEAAGREQRFGKGAYKDKRSGSFRGGSDRKGKEGV